MILQLTPIYKTALWGGTQMKELFHLPGQPDSVAEAWMLASHPEGMNQITGGPLAGQTLAQALQALGPEALGSRWKGRPGFPLMIKLIDAAQPLSIQVHPDDAYAQLHEGQPGKNEMWYVLCSQPGAYLYYGFRERLSREELEARLDQNTLTQVLNKVEVHPGDVFYLPAGTIHAIGPGILLAEIQQNSNLTYRIYDYDRTDAAGNKRPLNLPQALHVLRREPSVLLPRKQGCLYSGSDFTVTLMQGGSEDICDRTSFLSLLVLEGTGELCTTAETRSLQAGDSLFLPAGEGAFRLQGLCQVLCTRL